MNQLISIHISFEEFNRLSHFPALLNFLERVEIKSRLVSARYLPLNRPNILANWYYQSSRVLYLGCSSAVYDFRCAIICFVTYVKACGLSFYAYSIDSGIMYSTRFLRHYI